MPGVPCCSVRTASYQRIARSINWSTGVMMEFSCLLIVMFFFYNVLSSSDTTLEALSQGGLGVRRSNLPCLCGNRLKSRGRTGYLSVLCPCCHPRLPHARSTALDLGVDFCSSLCRASSLKLCPFSLLSSVLEDFPSPSCCVPAAEHLRCHVQ